jgi:hypothetical protein
MKHDDILDRLDKIEKEIEWLTRCIKSKHEYLCELAYAIEENTNEIYTELELLSGKKFLPLEELDKSKVNYGDRK